MRKKRGKLRVKNARGKKITGLLCHDEAGWSAVIGYYIEINSILELIISPTVKPGIFKSNQAARPRLIACRSICKFQWQRQNRGSALMKYQCSRVITDKIGLKYFSVDMRHESL